MLGLTNSVLLFHSPQSDDKSVKIWNTTDWTLAKTVTEPFKRSPGSTFFRRLRYAALADRLFPRTFGVLYDVCTDKSQG